MQSAEDRRRLQGRYADGQSGPLVAVLKCAAGIATLFAVAAGPWVVLSADGSGAVLSADHGAAAEQSVGKAAAAFPNSMEESRRVYEERRQRAQGQQEGTKAALAK
jgi:hypothetical protein